MEQIASGVSAGLQLNLVPLVVLAEVGLEFGQHGQHAQEDLPCGVLCVYGQNEHFEGHLSGVRLSARKNC